MCNETQETEINSSYDIHPSIHPSIHAYNLKSIHPKKEDKIIMGHRWSSVYWNLTQGEVEVSHQATNPLTNHPSIHLVFHPSTHYPYIYTFIVSHPSIHSKTWNHDLSVSRCSSAAQRVGTDLGARLCRSACKGRMEKEGFSRFARAKREFSTCSTCNGRM